MQIKQDAFVPRTRETVQADIDKMTAAYAGPSVLKPFPGARHCWFRVYNTGEIVPAYLITAPNPKGHIFPMPDFVRHDGLSGTPSASVWSHDSLHNMANNVAANVGRIKLDFKELTQGGAADSRWRAGVLGPAGKHAGKTFIVCAPGPSLRDNIFNIARMRCREDVVVMSFNRAMRVIESDYCMVVERWSPDAWRDDTVFELQKNASLITVPQAHSRFIDGWRNRDAIYWGQVQLPDESDSDAIKSLWPIDAMASTSAACAVKCAYEMGAAKIILVGMDFCAEFTCGVHSLDLAPEKERALFDRYRAVAQEIVEGKGPQAANEAGDCMAEEKGLRDNGYSFKWEVGRFYFDQDFGDTSYVGDPRFSSWTPVQACDGHMVGATRELFLYCDQIKTVFGCIESGSDCRVINASPEGLLDWRGVDGVKPHPPMSLDEAMEWKEQGG